MDLSGVYPPITTPFLDDGCTLDLVGAKSNAERWMTTGLRGLVALGSNGESALVDEAEADRFVETVRAAMPRNRLLIVGTGRESTQATIGASQRAAALGADAVLVRTPSFFKPQMTDEVFLRHYGAVADASPVPVILYNFTALTGVALSVPVVARLSRHPSIVGMKESGGDADFVSSLVEETAGDFQVLVGSAPTFFSSLMCGADGGIMALACVAPDACVSIYDLVRAGQIDDARTLQRKVTPLAKLVTRRYGVPGLKAALGLLGYVGGPPRPPLVPAEPDAVNELSTALEALERATLQTA